MCVYLNFHFRPKFELTYFKLADSLRKDKTVRMGLPIRNTRPLWVLLCFYQENQTIVGFVLFPLGTLDHCWFCFVSIRNARPLLVLFCFHQEHYTIVGFVLFPLGTQDYCGFCCGDDGYMKTLIVVTFLFISFSLISFLFLTKTGKCNVCIFKLSFSTEV